jgi:hypothetical protein
MSEPWFEPNTFGAWWGAIVGGGGGSLIGLIGGLAGWLAPRGIGLKTFQIVFGAFALLGVVFLAVGIVALVDGQPYGIWYAFLLTGGLFTILCGWAVFYVRHIGTKVEQRRLQSEAIRHS